MEEVRYLATVAVGSSLQQLSRPSATVAGRSRPSAAGETPVRGRRRRPRVPGTAAGGWSGPARPPACRAATRPPERERGRWRGKPGEQAGEGGGACEGPAALQTEFTKAMEGSLWHEFETGLPAADVWEVYGGLLVGDLIPKLLPQVFSKVELVEGDGGVGTVLLVTFPPGTPGSESFKEEFIKVDNENCIKEVLVTEGSFLNHGFKKYLVRTDIIGKEQKASTIRSTIEYEVDQEHASNPPVVSTSGLATIAKAITEYIKEKKGLE